MDSINKKALVQSSPPIPSLNITLSPSRLGFTRAVPIGLYLSTQLRGFLGLVGCKEPLTACLHCCPMVPSLLLDQCPEHALLSMFDLACLLSLPALLQGCTISLLNSVSWEERNRESYFVLPEALLRRRAAPSLFVSQIRTSDTSVPQGHWAQGAHCRRMHLYPKRWSNSIISFGLTSIFAST